jgi:hypothetical protein
VTGDDHDLREEESASTSSPWHNSTPAVFDGSGAALPDLVLRDVEHPAADDQ